MHHDSTCVLQINQDIMVSSCQNYDGLAVHTHTDIHTPAKPPFRRNSLQNVCTCAASGRVRQRSASSARPDAGTTAPLTAETCARAGEESERIWAGAGRGGMGVERRGGVYI